MLSIGGRQTGRKESHTLEGTILRQTTQAIHFRVMHTVNDTEDIWFPLSQVVSIHNTASILNGTHDKLVVTKWIAKQKGLI